MQRDANTTCTVEEKEKLVTKAHEFYKLRKSKYLARSSFAHFVQAYLARKKTSTEDIEKNLSAVNNEKTGPRNIQIY